eukprot:358514-Chlamydomonas_euryale.AAC.7
MTTCRTPAALSGALSAASRPSFSCGTGGGGGAGGCGAVCNALLADGWRGTAASLTAAATSRHERRGAPRPGCGGAGGGRDGCIEPEAAGVDGAQDARAGGSGAGSGGGGAGCGSGTGIAAPRAGVQGPASSWRGARGDDAGCAPSAGAGEASEGGRPLGLRFGLLVVATLFCGCCGPCAAAGSEMAAVALPLVGTAGC